MASSSSGGGVGFLSLLFLLFIGLKLSGVIAWSWWWVTAPAWGGLALLVVAVLTALAGVVLSRIAKQCRKA